MNKGRRNYNSSIVIYFSVYAQEATKANFSLYVRVIKKNQLIMVFIMFDYLYEHIL
jgi:hypothetical protein